MNIIICLKETSLRRATLTLPMSSVPSTLAEQGELSSRLHKTAPVLSQPSLFRGNPGGPPDEQPLSLVELAPLPRGSGRNTKDDFSFNI